MNMKRKISGFLSMLLLLNALFGTIAVAETRESVAFKITSIALTTGLYAEFRATTNRPCSTIKVSSCVLQEMNGSTVVSSKSLSAPGPNATNSSTLNAYADYSAKGTHGKSYRIKATFWADGYTVTAYSRIVNY